MDGVWIDPATGLLTCDPEADTERAFEIWSFEKAAARRSAELRAELRGIPDDRPLRWSGSWPCPDGHATQEKLTPRRLANVEAWSS